MNGISNEAFVLGMEAVGAGIALIAGVGPGIGEGFLRRQGGRVNRETAGSGGRYHENYDYRRRNCGDDGSVRVYLRVAVYVYAPFLQYVGSKIRRAYILS